MTPQRAADEPGSTAGRCGVIWDKPATESSFDDPSRRVTGLTATVH
ncbi:hypothetical protein QSJ19_20970 [Gordonia sp. ABSL11-1]|nr:hypothetical protein [Gordonia sp. ABSL11-1]MDL9948011.1 hypothetical protein [Gordonia sp. ABSL11-1]